MRKVLFLVSVVAGLVICIGADVEAADVEAVLDDAAGASAFSVKDSGSVEGAHIDSDGNMVIKGGLRLDASGVENTTAENLIVDGNVGIGTTEPAGPLEVKDPTAGGTIGVRITHNVYPRLQFNNIGSGGGISQIISGIVTNDDLAITQGTGGTGAVGTVRMYFKNDGNVGIGTTSPNAAALLDVSSTTKGFLPPRMTTTERDAITTPPAGLMIYNTTTNKLNVYTTTWEVVTSA